MHDTAVASDSSIEGPEDLPRLAVSLEEVVTGTNGTVTVVDSAGLDIDPATVSVFEMNTDAVRVLCVMDQNPSPDGAMIRSHLENTFGEAQMSSVADPAEINAPSAIVASAADGSVAAVVYLASVGGVVADPSEGEGPRSAPAASSTGGLAMGLLRNVPLEVTVELGRVNASMESILNYTIGSVVELDRLASSPVDLLVNGSIIGRGEVVVVAEEYAVRITELEDNR